MDTIHQTVYRSFMRIILASTSPRRRELLKTFNLSFEIITKNVEEVIDETKDVYNNSVHLAYLKAKSVYDDIKEDAMVIGSDTIVYCDNKIYGKPRDYQDAVNILKELSGKSHEVISSLCVLIRKNKKEYQELTYDKCKVYIDKMSINEINDWIKSNDVYTKAGAYAIQEGFGKYIKRIEGDYFSIVGFPLHKMYQVIKKYDIK